MARYKRGRMALYEVMSKTRVKPTLEDIRAGKPERDDETKEGKKDVDSNITKSPKVIEDSAAAAPVPWRRKPRVVQINAGRIEFSVPYQIAIAILLGLVAIMLIVYQAGQRAVVDSGVSRNEPVPEAISNRIAPDTRLVKNRANPIKPAEKPKVASVPSPAPATAGNNVIVLAQYSSQRDLVPVMVHFENYGIATEIVQSSGLHFLITKDRYNSFGRSGDGTEAVRKIAEVGAQYKGKAPEGYEPFAPHYFSDAYGKNVNQL